MVGGCVCAELIESCMYLYQATKDPFLLEVAVEVLEAIEHNAKTLCGYATVSSSLFYNACPAHVVQWSNHLGAMCSRA